jgi:hypothetical protein
MGFSEAEIAASLEIDKAAVHRHIETIRREGSWADKTGKRRFADLLQQVIDGTMLTVKEAWALYGSKDNARNLMARVALLGRVQSGMSLLAEFIPGSESISFEERVIDLRKRADEELVLLKKQDEERRLANRIQPLSAGS